MEAEAMGVEGKEVRCKQGFVMDWVWGRNQRSHEDPREFQCESPRACTYQQEWGSAEGTGFWAEGNPELIFGYFTWRFHLDSPMEMIQATEYIKLGTEVISEDMHL